MFYSDAKRRLPLIVAAYNGCKDVVELLIANGANVHSADDKGHTPLHIASMRGHIGVVESLIANGAKIDAEAEDGCTPLYMAASFEHRDIAQLFLKYGAVTEPDIAVMLGEMESVKHNLEQGVDVNSKLAKGLRRGDSWLITAIGSKHKNHELVELLLNYGARINERTGGTIKFSPLHQASIRGSREICELLIANGAHVNVEDKFGNTPLYRAASIGHRHIVELLLNSGTNLNGLNLEKRNALFEAARLHHSQVVASLLAHGIEVNLTDERGFTPLLCAFQKIGGDEIIRALVASGANVNVRTHEGHSPLLIAVAQGSKDMVELLLAHGAREGLDA
jgi:ankyrin repeat protein